MDSAGPPGINERSTGGKRFNHPLAERGGTEKLASQPTVSVYVHLPPALRRLGPQQVTWGDGGDRIFYFLPLSPVFCSVDVERRRIKS